MASVRLHCSMQPVFLISAASYVGQCICVNFPIQCMRRSRCDNDIYKTDA